MDWLGAFLEEEAQKAVVWLKNDSNKDVDAANAGREDLQQDSGRIYTLKDSTLCIKIKKLKKGTKPYLQMVQFLSTTTPIEVQLSDGHTSVSAHFTDDAVARFNDCLLYTSPSPRD